MGFFQKIKEGLGKTHNQLVHEIKRIVSRSPRLTEEGITELEAALLSTDLGLNVTEQIIEAVRKSYETQGTDGLDIYGIAAREIEKVFQTNVPDLRRNSSGPTVISLVGVNGTGKTTTAAKLGQRLTQQGHPVTLAACDTFRAAAIEQLKLWGQRLDIPVISGAHAADPASVAHDAATAALSRNSQFLLLDTAGRLHTKHNLMQELQKLHRVVAKKIPDAPHEVLLVLDATTGMNAMNQAREFHKMVQLTGLVITKLDGTSKGGMVVSIYQELGIPVKFIGVGEQPEDLQPFDGAEFGKALFEEATT